MASFPSSCGIAVDPDRFTKVEVVSRNKLILLRFGFLENLAIVAKSSAVGAGADSDNARMSASFPVQAAARATHVKNVRIRVFIALFVRVKDGANSKSYGIEGGDMEEVSLMSTPRALNFGPLGTRSGALVVPGQDSRGL